MNQSIIQHLRATVAALALVSIAPLAMAQASAPTVRSVVVSESLQKKLEKDYGVREANVLKSELQRTVNRSLSQAGRTKVAWVNLTISDARPNKPTFEQMSKNTSISYGDSLGVGGAKIEATLYDSSGAVLGSVKHSWFSNSLQDVTALTTWGDASRAFSGAAHKIRKEAERDI